MRKFWINYDGRLALDLNGGSHINPQSVTATEQTSLDGALFLSGVTGLGASFDAEFVYAGSYSYAMTQHRPTQIVIAGILNIKRGTRGLDPYYLYQLLVPLITGKVVTFQYCPYSSFTPEYNYAFSLDGYVTKLTKTEKKAGLLQVGFEFRAISPWYKTGSSTLTAELTAGGTYTFSGMGTYGTAFNAYFTAKSSVSNFKATITRDGAELACLAYSSTIAANRVLRWSTDPKERLITINGVDILSSVDLTHNIYPLIKAGDVLTIGSGTTGTLSFTATYKNFYGGC